MVLKIGDWHFQVDVEATSERTRKYSYEHCQCGYCKNFYDAIDMAHPELRPVMEQFGVHLEGPCELMPFEPTYLLACYRIHGSILQWGRKALSAGDVRITVETADNGTFFLWVGEMELPWLQEEDCDEVVSPANLPEFLERMETVWLLRHGENGILS